MPALGGYQPYTAEMQLSDLVYGASDYEPPQPDGYRPPDAYESAPVAMAPATSPPGLVPAGTAPPPTQTVSYPTATGAGHQTPAPETQDISYGQQITPDPSFSAPPAAPATSPNMVTAAQSVSPAAPQLAPSSPNMTEASKAFSPPITNGGRLRLDAPAAMPAAPRPIDSQPVGRGAVTLPAGNITTPLDAVWGNAAVAADRFPVPPPPSTEQRAATALYGSDTADYANRAADRIKAPPPGGPIQGAPGLLPNPAMYWPDRPTAYPQRPERTGPLIDNPAREFAQPPTAPATSPAQKPWWENDIPVVSEGLRGLSGAAGDIAGEAGDILPGIAQFLTPGMSPVYGNRVREVQDAVGQTPSSPAGRTTRQAMGATVDPFVDRMATQMWDAATMGGTGARYNALSPDGSGAALGADSARGRSQDFRQGQSSNTASAAPSGTVPSATSGSSLGASYTDGSFPTRSGPKLVLQADGSVLPGERTSDAFAGGTGLADAPALRTLHLDGESVVLADPAIVPKGAMEAAAARGELPAALDDAEFNAIVAAGLIPEGDVEAYRAALIGVPIMAPKEWTPYIAQGEATVDYTPVADTDASVTVPAVADTGGGSGWIEGKYNRGGSSSSRGSGYSRGGGGGGYSSGGGGGGYDAGPGTMPDLASFFGPDAFDNPIFDGIRDQLGGVRGSLRKGRRRRGMPMKRGKTRTRGGKTQMPTVPGGSPSSQAALAAALALRDRQ